jgi:hypothetical protein
LAGKLLIAKIDPLMVIEAVIVIYVLRWSRWSPKDERDTRPGRLL